MKGIRCGWKFLACAAVLAASPQALAQGQPYIGFAYPAGGRQGTTVEIRIGGQALDYVQSAKVTGAGVSARIVDNWRRFNNQETQLLREQLEELERASPRAENEMSSAMQGGSEKEMTAAPTPVVGKSGAAAAAAPNDERQRRMVRIKLRLDEHVQTPACASIAALALLEVTIAPDAAPGRREIRLVTSRGVSNPLAFWVGQFPENTRKPMRTSSLHVLGKEAQSLRERPAEEAECRVALPCTLNGQIAPGEINRYRFSARKGQRLVFAALGRQLVPFIADAVPGWFQPVMVLQDESGREIAYADDYRFRPDPVILCEAPRDGEYVLSIRDGIYRGREDFVYRITAGEIPFVTSIFPLGRGAQSAQRPEMQGWNLQGASLSQPAPGAADGIFFLTASRGPIAALPVPFALDALPDVAEREPNNARVNAQHVDLPAAINGRIGKSDDWDVYRFDGKPKQVIVAEVLARRLDSPLDSVIKLTDSMGSLIAFNDDREDLAGGMNTHHADSWLMAELPARGEYFLHVGDTARMGGEEYGYRLRLSAPQPDFDLRVAPSSLRIRAGQSAQVTVYVQRRDGFNGPVKLSLKSPPAGFFAAAATIPADKASASLSITAPPSPTKDSAPLTVIGSAEIDAKELVREAVACDDRMQAFLWRHLLPAADLQVVAYDPNYEPAAKRTAPPIPAPPPAAPVAPAPPAAATAAGTPPAKPKFTEQQIAGRLKELKRLYEEDLLVDSFYLRKVAECQAAQ